tara:strand:+ start:13 stop:555 length:543 start_codon:yes stop_codon:yes gene_type:complete
MALFGKSRDISLFHSLNNELLKDIIQTEIAYYKFALEQTNVNVYGEAPGKNYYEPMKIACLINRDDQAWSSDNFGSDVNQNISFSFLKNELININLVPEVGDLILFRNNFYEADGKVENQLIMGRDKDYAISTETIDFGESFSVLITTHISRVSKLNLIPLIGGKYPSTTKTDGGITNPI